MKEIHAYKNDDGTYRVEIIGPVKSSRLQQGKGWVDEVTQSTTEIPRASIQITAYASYYSDDVLCTITLDGDKNE